MPLNADNLLGEVLNTSKLEVLVKNVACSCEDGEKLVAVVICWGKRQARIVWVRSIDSSSVRHNVECTVPRFGGLAYCRRKCPMVGDTVIGPVATHMSTEDPPHLL